MGELVGTPLSTICQKLDRLGMNRKRAGGEMGPHSKIGLEGLLLEIWSGSAHQDETLRLGRGALVRELITQAPTSQLRSWDESPDFPSPKSSSHLPFI